MLCPDHVILFRNLHQQVSDGRIEISISLEAPAVYGHSDSNLPSF